MHSWHSRHDLGEHFPRDGAGFLGEFRDEEVLSEEDRFVAGLAIREIGDIDDDLIHRDTPKERAAFSFDEDFAVLDGTGVAIAVSDSEDSSFGVFF